MDIDSVNLTQGSCFLSEEIRGAKLSLIMIIDCYQIQHCLEQVKEDGIADFHKASVVGQEEFRCFGC